MPTRSCGQEPQSSSPLSCVPFRSLRPPSPAPPPQPISVPSTPHPLPPTMTPIQPVFARPEKTAVKFNTEPIMRGDSEGTLIPRRGDKGDDFWRRFSMIAKEESSHKERLVHSPFSGPGGGTMWKRVLTSNLQHMASQDPGWYNATFALGMDCWHPSSRCAYSSDPTPRVRWLTYVVLVHRSFYRCWMVCLSAEH